MPKAVGASLQAIRLLAGGDWEGAHALVQDDPSPEAAWVHYWYRRAGRPIETGELEDERSAIEEALTRQPSRLEPAPPPGDLTRI